jgi:DNA helicase-2/ATP-dependent DNA helicase PcrA
LTQTLKIFGPPGTGKTRTLLEEFERELIKVAPNRIAFLTFTRAARLEALSRSKRTEDELPFLRTIHAVCYHHLGMTSQQLVRPRDLRNFGAQLGIRVTGNVKNPWEVDEIFNWEKPSAEDALLQMNHLGRHQQIKLREAMRFADQEITLAYAKWFTQAYRKWKQTESLVDFTDLLTDYLEYGRPLDIDVMFIDEAQDLSRLQWDVVAKLGANASRVYIAGDDDQAIFTWAGADPMRFSSYPATKERVLDVSYRLPRKVHKLAKGITARIDFRVEKEFKPRDEDGEVRPVGFLDPTILNGVGETFILFRNHYRGRALAYDLEQISWPYIGENSVLSNQMVSAALHGWHNAVNRQPLSPSQARAIAEVSTPTWLNPKFLELSKRDRSLISVEQLLARRPELNDWHTVLAKLPGREYIARCVRFYGWDAVLKPRTTLMSIHKSKGREANTVVLDTELTRKTYDSWMDSPDAEHRVFYVAVTRAMQRLFTLLPTSDWVYHL